MRKTVKHLLTEYGKVAVVVYFVLFFAVLFGIWGAIQLGWRTDSVSGNVGAFTAAYLATKVTQPLRIAATVALTPLVAAAYERITGRKPSPRTAKPPEPAEQAGPADGD